MDPLKLLAHPVRLRIIHALRGGRVLTAGGLGDRLGDVSRATVYRHLELLTEAGVLQVAEERRVRGAVERHYRLRGERAGIDAAQIAALTKDDHRVGFAAATAALQAEFAAYLERQDSDPVADQVGYRQHAVWLSPRELEALIGALRVAILPALGNEAQEGRAQYLVSPILFPIEQS
ncbi:putative transcriptional regulator [Catenulispora acidiphila DSM 44928]|uniref:Putative transcriptional regulator n=1 Tax=Catenulispora acidiphila (strain DSM 44928 / JCM 14897 / NBRC 102108 / NRRL B-24433 / ID139908) TaxID=479433 RepID=C7QED4_CATAD|nr:helix-turn-helix domain-containing protein [Catenulispora acidiphila]ACU70825.1 putative transcriptional regulator [Catenulispora acidiphila DSM 44928]